ncbi:MAG: hypothetical protein COA47_05390 [Robiginitomaculum sp.]|nr:MAG: hypothetical protein COA47_05390 [Robiginitomaculum sp.]
MIKSTFCAAALFVVLIVNPALAGPEAFHAGTVIPAYGKVAMIAGAELPADTKFKVAFDVGTGTDVGKINRGFEGAARFINMHVEAGVPVENIQLAIVVHGKASWELTNDAWYKAKTETDEANANAPLLAALMDNGVEIFLCGQSAAWHGVSREDLLPGIEMSLSAMTAHALLQQQGYSLNPF